jgi:gamma-glutamylcyclotransferase (GGCT)/AIG2-like uncharacterized protein YtfP
MRSTETTSNNLFVYGSLRRGEENHRWVEGYRSVRAASVDGRLYALPEGYPALCLDVSDDVDRVFGELLCFDALAPRLSALDDFEGVVDGAADASLFIRRLIRVTVADAGPQTATAKREERVESEQAEASIHAWVYVMPPGREMSLIARGARRLRDGRWTGKGRIG